MFGLLLCVLGPLSVPPPPTPVVSRVRTADPVVFVTIDDGFTRSRPAAATIERLSWPVTSFVMPAQLARDPRYFTTLGPEPDLANHTLTHRDLTRLSYAAQRREICGARARVQQLTGTQIRFFRPPGGAYDTTTLRAAAACKMSHTVMWRVTVSNGEISTWGGAPIQRGDVILLHYVGSLDRSLRVLARELGRLGLHPAPLSAYLPPLENR